MSNYSKYCRLDAKSAAVAMQLPPMPFRIHIPVMAMPVPGSNPSRTGVWRLFPPAGLPAIGIAIPTVVSADPDMIPARASGTMLMDADRGTKLYDDLCLSGYYPKGKAKQRCKNQVSHFLLLGIREQMHGRSRGVASTHSQRGILSIRW